MSIHEQFIYQWLREFKLYQRIKKPLTKAQKDKLKDDYRESNEVIYRLRRKWKIRDLEILRQQENKKRIRREKCRAYYQRNKNKLKVARCLKP
jgi:hypothetical protein